jgi:hypothetical protein
MFKECSSGDETPHIGESKEGRWTLVKRQLYTKKNSLPNFQEHHFICLQDFSIKLTFISYSLLLAKVNRHHFISPKLGDLTDTT